MSSKKVQTLSPFPQYVSKVQRIITEQKQQWFSSTETRRKRGRSSRPLQNCTEAQPSPKLPQRQRPLPRTLSPLHKLRRKPSPNVAADAPRSGRRRNDQLQDLSERGISGISHLVVPVPGFYGQGNSSCSSSSSNSPVPTSLITLQLGCKSKESLSSGSSDQSPPAFKRATPISLNVIGENERDQSTATVELQRARSQNSLSMQRACSKSPYMAPLGVVRKKSRRAKKAQQLKPADRSRDQGGVQRTASSRETLVTPITLVSRDAPPVSQCAIKIWNPSESSEETATGARDQQVGNNCTITVSTFLQEPDGALCIPTITIRSATPIKAPNDDENLLALCEKLAFRADMEDELDRLREEIKALSDSSNTSEAPTTQ